MRSSHCIDEKRRKNFFFPFEKNQLIAAKLKFAMIFFFCCAASDKHKCRKKDHENLFRKTKNDLVSESFRVELKHKMIGPLINTIGFRLYRFEDAL